MPKVEAKEQPKQQPPPAQPRIDELLMKPGKYEVTPEDTFTVDVNLILHEGRWLLANGPAKGVESHKVVFRMWAYDEMVAMRKMATAFDAVRRLHLTDNDALNRLKVQKLLVSWTFDRDNPRLKLFHVNGTMTDESWQAFVRLQSNIIQHIFEEMNSVYEGNC